MRTFQLRFAQAEIPYWASRYAYPRESVICEDLAPRVRVAGYFTKADLLEIGRWKSKRIGSRLEGNSEEQVEEVTRIALSCKSERLRIGALIQLEGVDWCVASTLLHFCHSAPYPLLDKRALWSLGFEKTPFYYNFDLWWSYTQHCRELAKAAGVSMRVLDRALWQFSKENQPNGRGCSGA